MLAHRANGRPCGPTLIATAISDRSKITMVSDKVRRILISKGAPFDVEALEGMSDAEGWAWIYGHETPTPKKAPEICFTGFGPTEKVALEALAGRSGLHVAKTVTRNLAYLCVGANAGPAKRRKAEAQGAKIIDEGEFRSICAAR